MIPRMNPPFLQHRWLKGLARTLAGGWLGIPAWAEDNPLSLADLTIEQLMNESVTSVSKKETKLSESPAAISVITADDIARLGITSIPEALRLAPGMDVARVDASHWAISSRGFNVEYANKLLVLMDGRSLYTPSFGGVLWGSQDMMLEDMERIEVIRGPGATLWGANAVNGVVNITSKNSKDTQGLLIATAAGTEEQPGISVRYGGELSPDLHYRVYLKYFNRDGLVDPAGNGAHDGWDSVRGGFRTDWTPTSEDLVTLQGDFYSVRGAENFTSPLLRAPFSQNQNIETLSTGGNVLGRWTRTFSDTSRLSLQAYFDYFSSEGAVVTESRDTADVQLEYRFALGSRNDVVWGLGYRFTTDEFSRSQTVVFDPLARDLNLYTAFVQDEITLVPKRLRLTLGSKFEHNDYTGWEIQPSARLLWTPAEHQSVWVAASHAVSTPSQIYREGRVSTGAFQPSPDSPVFETAVIGNSNVISETLDAYELGYRIEPASNLSFDLATFYNVYHNVIGTIVGAPRFETDPQPHMLLPVDWANNMSGESYGAELSMQWKPAECWRLIASYGWLHMHLRPDNTDSLASPQQQATLRSYLSLPWNLELNGLAAFVDKVVPRNNSFGTTPIPAYIRADIGLVWHASKTLDIGVWGHNLLDNHHPESASQTTNVITEMPRSVMAKVTWRF